MQVTFFGVRGSTPCNGDEIAKYGGNTSCVAVRAPGEDPLFFDLGTGARYLGRGTQWRSGTFHGTLPAESPALGSHAGTAVLHATARRKARRSISMRLRKTTATAWKR